MWVPALLSLELKEPSPLCYVSFSVACLSFSFLFLFLFFAEQGSVCAVGYAGLSQGWLWGYCMLLICSPVGLHLPSRLGAGIWWCRSPPGFSIYLVWGSYVWAGGSRVSEFCLFLVVFPARCVCRDSARFLLYRAHAICFFPLVAILEPLPLFIFLMLLFATQHKIFI
jgi:hypothetical protein